MGTQATTTTPTHNAWDDTEHISYISVVTYPSRKTKAMIRVLKKKEMNPHTPPFVSPHQPWNQNLLENNFTRFVKSKYIFLLDS